MINRFRLALKCLDMIFLRYEEYFFENFIVLLMFYRADLQQVEEAWRHLALEVAFLENSITAVQVPSKYYFFILTVHKKELKLDSNKPKHEK